MDNYPEGDFFILPGIAGVVELADTGDLKSPGFKSCTGSSPVSGNTTF
jgi:hypothetical protein